jgi:hypothetical protein
VVPPQKPAGAAFPVTIATGDLPAAGETDKIVADKPDVIFHLARSATSSFRRRSPPTAPRRRSASC